MSKVALAPNINRARFLLFAREHSREFEPIRALKAALKILAQNYGLECISVSHQSGNPDELLPSN